MIDLKIYKEQLKKWFCKHHPHDIELIRWCEKHIPESEPICAVLEYKCNHCGKYFYIYARGKEYSDWVTVMGTYKKEVFYSER